MQKYIQRQLNVALLCGALFVSLSQASDEIIRFSMPSQDTTGHKEFLMNLNDVAQKSVLNYGQFNETNASSAFQKQKNDSVESLFYFYSKDMPFVALQNLFPQMKKFKETNPKARIYVVYNNFPSQGYWKELKKLHKNEYNSLFSIKIDPRLFNAYELRNAPAWAIAKCPEDFKFKQCDINNSILAKGDISLVDFFELLTKHDKQYLTTYQNLIKAN